MCFYTCVSFCSEGGLCQGDPPYGNVRTVRIILECILVPSAYRNVLRLHDDGRYMSRRQVQSDARLHLLHEFLRQRRLWHHLEEENDALLGPVFTPL